MLVADERRVVQILSKGSIRARAESGFTLVELIISMAMMLIVLTAVSATFVSGTHSETNASNRIRGESDARQALSKMRDDLHCSFAVTSVTQNSLGGFTLTMTEFYNTCKAVDQNPGSGSKVLLSYCTIPNPGNSNVFDLYRENNTCDASGTRVVASDVVQPASGWPQNTSATGIGGTGVPSSWAGNIWPTTPTCQLGYLQTQAVDMAVNPNFATAPNSRYELKDQIALRNSTRCGTGTGTLAGPSLTVTVPASSAKNTAITPSATVAGSSNETSPITFFVWKQPTAPTDCTSGGTSVGTAATAGDGAYASSLSYTPTTAGDHLWWYASLPADSNNAAVVSACGPGMPTTTVTNGPASPTLTMSVPATASKSVLIPPASIGALLASSSGATTGAISFYVIQQAAAPTTCPGAMTLVGTASPTADGTWNPGLGYTPSSTTNKLWWFASFAGDTNDSPAKTTCGAGMASTTVGLPTPTLSVVGPATGTKNVTIPAASIVSTLGGSVGGTTATITVSVFGPAALAPLTCTGAGWSTVGISTPAGNGSYSPSAGYLPTAAGTYWWYASYAGDANNSPASSACGASMSSTVVGLPDTFVVAPVGAPETAGTAFNVTITATLPGGGTDTSFNGAQSVVFSGPANGPNGTTPVYPATVTFTNGVGTALGVKLYKAGATTLTATLSAITGTSASFTVKAGAASAFTFTNCSANGGAVTDPCAASISTGKSPGYATLHVSVLDAWGNTATVTGSTLTVTFSNTPAGKFTLTGTATIAVGASESSAVTATNQGNNNSAVIQTTNAGFTQAQITVQR